MNIILVNLFIFTFLRLHTLPITGTELTHIWQSRLVTVHKTEVYCPSDEQGRFSSTQSKTGSFRSAKPEIDRKLY